MLQHCLLNQRGEDVKKNISLFSSLLQFIKFGIVGTINTIVNYVIYNFVYHLIIPNVHIANLCGFIISVFSAFLLQNRFVFKKEESEERSMWKTLAKTYVSYSFTGLFLTEILLFMWINLINLSQYISPLCEWLNGFGFKFELEGLAASIAPVLNMVITVPLNFVINKFWAYKKL